MDQALYTIRSVMEMLSVSHATIYRMIERGELEAVKVGYGTRITGVSIDKIINAHKPPPVVGEDVAPTSGQRREKAKALVTEQKRGSESNLEKRVAALEREVASLRKLISRLKEAINE